MVEIGARQYYSSDGRIAQRIMQRAGVKRGRAFDLRSQVGRGSREKPRGAVRAQRQLSLRASFAGGFLKTTIIAHGNAVSAAAIPLRKPAPGRRTGDPDV